MNSQHVRRVWGTNQSIRSVFVDKELESQDQTGQAEGLDEKYGIYWFEYLVRRALCHLS